MRRQDFSRNVGIGSSSQGLLGYDKISLSRVIYNWKINIITGSMTWKRNMNLGNRIPEKSEK